MKTLLLSLTFMATSIGLFAFPPSAFDQNAFEAAQKSSKVILVDVYAEWCSTCKAQHKDLEAILKDSKFKEVVSFKIDYDDKDLVKKFEKVTGKKIPRQSTIFVFRGAELVSMSVAEREEKLKAEIEKAFPKTKS